ncbi:glutamate-rich protein 2 [Engystomops pustulosus]|uniref:glutamate-rich protein 2 n=1 Tax=Engystomops pustulosus TaxID=76066 RepID=UPI003AFA4AE5
MNRAEVCGAVSKVSLCKALGKLEVLDPEDGDYTKGSAPMSSVCKTQESTTKRPISFQNGKLEVLGPKDEVVIHPCEAASRPGSSTGRQGSAGRRSYIPTKHIPLCVVKPLVHSSDIPNYSVVPKINTKKQENAEPEEMAAVPRNTDEKEAAGPPSLAAHNGNIKGRLEESSDEEESDDESARAPLELLAEFINAVMDEDYQVAQKLCQMILLYEPENPEAKMFSPLIEEMLQIEQQQSSEDDDSDDSEDETDEETSEDTSDTDEEENQHCTAKHTS